MLGESWKGFKENFLAILSLFILLSVIPSLILGYIGLPMKNVSSPLDFYSTSQGNLYLVLSFLFMFLTTLLSASILVMSFSNKKLKFKEAISSGSRYWILYTILYILISIFTVLLAIPSAIAIYFAVLSANTPLLILGIALFALPIYFMTKSILALPILVGENKKIFPSIKRSFEITKGKFWKVFFSLFLIALILLIVTELFGTIGYLINYASGNATISTDAATNLQSIVYTNAGLFIQQIFALAASLISLPLTLIFFKNLYLEIKEKK